MSWLALTFEVLAALVAGFVVPALAARALVPTLESSEAALRRNYRGRVLAVGLGVVWGVWGVSLALLVGALAFSGVFMVSMGSWLVLAALAMGAAFFGIVDDAFGTGEDRGFGGHLRALRSGRLTTGALKMFGIGALSMFAAVVAAARATISSAAPGAFGFAAGWFLGVLTISLCANAFNLLDLRPGRALKVYLLLVPVGLVATVFEVAAAQGWRWQYLSDIPVLAVLLLGPALATWRYDLREQAMQGDAGANAMGVVAGYLLAASLPLWGLAVAAALLLAFNLGSERVSYSTVIDGNAFLRRLDLLGRQDDGGPEKESG